MQPLPQTADAWVQQPPPGRTSRIPYSLFFMLYGLFAVYFYFVTIVPYLASSDLYAPRILADAITYEAICVSESNFLDLTTLRDIGPCVGLRLFSYNSGPLSLFNATIIVLSVIWLARVYQRPWKPLLALVMINPITFLSIFGPNKEVFGLITFATLAIFIRSRSLSALGICLVAALFTRLPTLVVVTAYCLMLVIALPRRGVLGTVLIRRYYFMIVAMLVLVSAVAAIFGSQIQYNLLGDFSRAEDISQSTTISLSIDNLSRYGMFAFVYVVRLIFNLYSGMIGLFNLMSGSFPEYYTVGVSGSSILFSVLTIVAIAGKTPDDMNRTAIMWNMILFLVMFTFFLSLSPVIQHRYFYPIYIFLLLFVVQRDNDLISREKGDAGVVQPAFLNQQKEQR